MSAQQIQELFKKFDKDGNGRISVSELQSVLQWINKDITMAEIGKILREVDTNNDGAIDYNEFVAWTQGGKKTLAGKNKKANALVPDLQAALQRSEEEAAALASMPLEAVMSVSYMGEIKQFDKSGKVLEAIGVRTPSNQRFTSVEDDIKLLEKIKDPHQLNLNCFSVDWGSRNVVTGSADHTLKLWNFYGNVLRTYTGHTSEVLCVEVDWRSHRMLSGSLGSDLKLWRLDSSSAVRTVTGSCTGGISCISVNWKMHSAICGCGNLLEVWDMSSMSEDADTPKCLHILRGHTGQVTAVHTEWSESILLSASMDSTLRRWDFKEGTLLQTFPVLSAEIRCMAYISETSVCTGDDRGNIQVWDTTAGTVQRVLTAHKDGVSCFSQVHGGHVVSGGRDGKLMYWRLSDGLCLQTVEVAEITAGVWVVGIAALPERNVDDRRKVMAMSHHRTSLGEM